MAHVDVHIMASTEPRTGVGKSSVPPLVAGNAKARRFGWRDAVCVAGNNQGEPVTRAPPYAAPLVFVRPGELRAAEWKEFDLAHPG